MTRTAVRPKFTAVILREKQFDSTRGTLLLGAAALAWLVIITASSPLTGPESAPFGSPTPHRGTVHDVVTGRAALDDPAGLYRPLPDLLRRGVTSPRARRFLRWGLLAALAVLLVLGGEKLGIGPLTRDARLWACVFALPLTFTALREPGSEDALLGWVLGLRGLLGLLRGGRLRRAAALGAVTAAGLCYEGAPLAVALAGAVLGHRRAVRGALGAFVIATGIKFMAVGRLLPHAASWRWGGSDAFAAGRGFLFLMIEGPVKLLWPGFDLGGEQPGWAFVLAGGILLGILLHGGRRLRWAWAAMALALVPLGAAPETRAAALLPAATGLVLWILRAWRPRPREFVLIVVSLAVLQGVLIPWPAREGRGERALARRIAELHGAVDLGVPARALRPAYEALHNVSPTLPGLPALKARLLFGEGRSGEAVLAAERARRLDPWDRRSRWFLAEHARVRRRGNREEILLREILRSCRGPADASSADRAMRRLVGLVRTGFADASSVRVLLARHRFLLSAKAARDVQDSLDAL